MLQRLLYKLKFLIAKLFLRGERLYKMQLVSHLLPYTMGGPIALESVFDIVSNTEKENIEGALIECGVAKGGCSAMMILASRFYGARRKLWLFDSYEGLPDPTENDFVGGKVGEMVGPLSRGMLVGTIEQVENLIFNKCQISKEDVRLVKGLFQDTLLETKNLIGKIAILRLDGDWYESTKCCLENLYDNVSVGGFVIIDDYATCYGSEKAVTEFVKERKIEVEFTPDGRGGVWFKKP